MINENAKWAALGGMLISASVLLAACGGDNSEAEPTTTPGVTQAAGDSSTATASTTAPATTEEATSTATTPGTVDSATSGSFVAEVWADNWFALYVNGELVGEDSVSITTERSFNAETITFQASYPLTIAIEAKDFKETDSGLEYIGAANQQMGDGGIIAQITDTSTGEVIAVTSSAWSSLVVHRAPLNTDCEKSADPDVACQFETFETPVDWTSSEFDDSAWVTATEWTEAAVSPKDGYNEIDWDSAARLIWGPDLEVDNTVLLRVVVQS